MSTFPPPSQAPLHASDINLIVENPLQYHLKRQRHIVPLYDNSTALSHGSWFHHWAFLADFSSPTIPYPPEPIVEKEVTKLRRSLHKYSVDPERINQICEDERHAAITAYAWFKNSLHVRVIKHLSWMEFLGQSRYRPLLKEALFSAVTPSGVPLAGQIDYLMYDQSTNRIWIVDYKTCTGSTTLRANACPYENANHHYNLLICLCLPQLIKMFNLPSNVTLGGMIHILIEKPLIRFGTKDRANTETETTKADGSVSTKRLWFGDPLWTKYIERCQDWYNGVGEFSNLATSRKEKGSPVNISYCGHDTNFLGYQDYVQSLPFYWGRAQEILINSGVHVPVKPSDILTPWNTEATYAQFAIHPPEKWPEIFVRSKFKRAPRFPIYPCLEQGIRLPEEVFADQEAYESLQEEDIQVSLEKTLQSLDSPPSEA
jgi:PD-(D/E)XK nuclease superfamily